MQTYIMNKNHFLLGLVFLILAQTMVGVNIVSSKLLLTSIPVLVLLDIRFILASFILFSLHWTTPARHESMLMPFLKLNLRDWGFIIAQALSAGVLFNCLMLTGLNYTDANVAGIITSALPAIIAIMSWLMLGEKISSQKALCVVFATLGLIMIAYDKYDGIGKSHSFFGDVIVLLSLLPEAGYYILFKLYPNKLPMFLVSALLNAINALILLPALFFIDWTPSAIHLSSWLILLTLGLSSGLFYVFWFIGSQRVDGIMASLSTATMPVATVILAWLILNEQLTLMEFIGMSVVILSIVLYAKR